MEKARRCQPCFAKRLFHQVISVNRKYSDEQVGYIRENITGRSFKELTAMFNARFGMDLKVSAVISFADRNGLHNGRDSRFNKGYAPTQFKKGHVPFNKGTKGISYSGMETTQFKKGNKPANWVPLGSERITKDDYIQIKVQDGKLQKNWRGKHILVWEEHNGPLPKGHVIVFGDKDKRNFDLENLILVSRKQLVRLNQHNLIQGNANLTRTGVIIADICNTIGERKRSRKESQIG